MSTLPKIIAVDFDGTLFENAWPDVGAPIEKNINKLKAEQADGAKVILWTNRVGGALDKAVNFCKEHGIHLDAVNENLPEIVQGFVQMLKDAESRSLPQKNLFTTVLIQPYR